MYTPTRRLPIVFTPLDVESKTKPVATVVCPVRGELMTVGNCGACPRFVRIEFTAESKPVLACTSGPARTTCLQQTLRLPTVCAAEDTTLRSLQHHLGPELQQDTIPVLDRQARPVGLARVADLAHELEDPSQLDVPLSQLANRRLVRATPETSAGDALRLALATGQRELVVVGSGGMFLGLVRARDLAN